MPRGDRCAGRTGTARAPIDVFACERDFPLGKGFAVADVKGNIIQPGLGSRTRGQAVLIAIDPHVGHGSIGRVGGRKTKYVMRETRECFAIRYADTNLHNVFYRCHRKLPFPANDRERKTFSLNFTDSTTSLASG